MRVSDLPLVLPPWPHQERELADAWDLPARGMLWGMRTGKTKVVVDTSQLLYEHGKISGVLVVAPNGIHTNWITVEVPKHSWPDRPYVARSWSSTLHRTDERYRARLETTLDPDFDGLRWLTVNSEVLISDRVQELVRRFLGVCGGRVMLVVDESDDFGRPGSRRTRLVRGLARKCPYRRILTGTAVLSSPLRAFSQFEILEPGALGFTRYGDFKPRYSVEVMTKRRDGRMFPSIDHYQNLEELRERIAQWASVVLREDVEGMPELLPIDCTVPLSEKQARAYRSMVKEMLIEMDDGEPVSALEGGVRAMKLQQILGGFVYDEYGDTRSIDDSPPRLDHLWRQVEGTLPGKVVVWCRFREDIRRVVARLGKEMGPGAVVEYHGGVSLAARIENLRSFQEDGHVYVLVGQPQAGGRGLDMSAAEAIMWYSHLHDARIREQAKERASKVHGQSIAIVDFHTPGTVEDGILSVLAGRVKLADMLAGTGLRDFLRSTDPLR